ncbi:hypothetical protein [Nonomuraea africana]|uniref:Uncharacterized protein n=1 Tax=Nonomuraea africana TaxID=46171 RepID=A0ABR9KTZ6_9ACTN|nr:hypothetical protein [Nonomuraea africana]MBE1564987.1 hypothetical protein [Nonomuraea africana]
MSTRPVSASATAASGSSSLAQTNLTAARSKEPAKTASLAQSSRSSASHSSWLQPIVARSAWWRVGPMPWGSLRSSRNLSLSRERICSAESADSRPAASSMASGMRSRWRQICATVRRSGSRSGWTSAALSMKRATASASSSGGSGKRCSSSRPRGCLLVARIRTP